MNNDQEIIQHLNTKLENLIKEMENTDLLPIELNQMEMDAMRLRGAIETLENLQKLGL
jgi:hypothetical protein